MNNIPDINHQCGDDQESGRSKRVALICPECDTTFSVIPSQVSRRVYCSRTCLHATPRTGKASAHWKGGAYIEDGYRMILVGGEHRREHRVVMERHLGRPLRDDEIVHHVDENRLNNAIDNLMVMSRAEHAKLHFEGKSWSKLHDSCIECGTTSRKHNARGLCNSCYERKRHREQRT